MTALTTTRTPLRTLALIALLGLVPQLQGCFPLIAGGAGATVLALDDRRSAGAQTEDKEIDLKGETSISQRFGNRVHVSVTSYNRNVLLTGETPDAAAKEQIEKTVREIANVRGVVNEIQLLGASSYSSRGNDTYLTSKVKARFIDEGKDFSANHVKVVTESSVVYLLGLVTRKEAEAAVDIARTTGGVQKVVRVFEYVEPTAVTQKPAPVKEPEPVPYQSPPKSK
ncbi:MAG: BON domain-containing protein [Proteobacteria bacterium]|nr:BON domain-containing protein [Pseudomonadota bacterium]